MAYPAASSPASIESLMLLGKVPRMDRRSIQHRSYHRRHRTLRNRTQILQMENHRKLSYRNRSSVIDILSFIYGDADLTTRLLFELFIGSSIFMAFFMATDPATTPFSGVGQIIFGVGLGSFDHSDTNLYGILRRLIASIVNHEPNSTTY